MKHLLLTATTLLLFSVAAFADEPLNNRIGDCVQKLGHPRFATREHAASELVAIGAPALKSLQAAALSGDEEIRQRSRVLVRLIEGRIRNESLIKAPTLRLQFTAVPLDEAVAVVAKKSGIPFGLDAMSGKNIKQSITFDSGDVPYWEAIEKFLVHAQLTEGNKQIFTGQNHSIDGQWNGTWGMIRRGEPLAKGTDNTVRLTDCKSPPPSSSASIVRVKMLPNEISGGILTKGTNEINLRLDVTPAPSAAWQGLVNISVTKAIDDRDYVLAQSHLTADRSIEPNSITWAANGLQAQGFVVNGGFGQGQLLMADGSFSGIENVSTLGNPRHVPVTLLGREGGSQTLKHLEGVVTVHILTPEQDLLRVKNICKASVKDSFESAGYRVEVTERRKDDKNQLHFRVVVFAPPNENPESSARVSTSNVTLQTASGLPVKNASINVYNQPYERDLNATEYLAVIPTVAEDADTVSLVVRGRQLATVDVPFVLKNIPLR